MYALIQAGPESYGYGARMAPEPCRAGADIIPVQNFKDALTFMSWFKRAPSRIGMWPVWPLSGADRAPL